MQVLPLDSHIFNTEAHPLPLPHTARDKELQSKYAKGPRNIDLAAERYSPEVLSQALAHYSAILPRHVVASNGTAEHRKRRNRR